MRKRKNPKSCHKCKKHFYPKNKKQKYCSRSCRYKHKQKPKKLTKFQVFHRDNFTCVYCGRSSIEDGAKLTIDHICPKSKNGIDSMDNLVTACKLCNKAKNDLYDENLILRVRKIINLRIEAQ